VPSPVKDATDDLLLAAILDDALAPLPSQNAAYAASAASQAAGLGVPIPLHDHALQQEMQDDAALAMILQGTPDAASLRRRHGAGGVASLGESGALTRVLQSLSSTRQGTQDTPRRDDATLARVLSGGLLSGRRTSGTSSARRDDAALSQVLEQLSPDDFSTRRDDDALARALGSQALGLEKSRVVLPHLVADVTEMLRQAKTPARAEVVAGGHGRGDRLNQLCNPVGLSVANDGTVFIADCGNCRILKIAAVPEGRARYDVGTESAVVAGGRENGYAWFEPVDVAFSEGQGDGEGSLLVTASGGVHLWGAQAPEGALIADGCLPSGLLLGGEGSLIFADALDHCVTRCAWRGGTALREVLIGTTKPEEGEVVASGDDLTRLHRPFGLAMDLEGAIIIADSGNHRIMRWLPGASEGEVVAGGRGRGPGLDQLNYPRSIVVERSGDILVADTFNHRILRWRIGASQGDVIFGGGPGSRLDQLNKPAALALAPGRGFGDRLLIADTGNHRVLSVNIPKAKGTALGAPTACQGGSPRGARRARSRR